MVGTLVFYNYRYSLWNKEKSEHDKKELKKREVLYLEFVRAGFSLDDIGSEKANAWLEKNTEHVSDNLIIQGSPMPRTEKPRDLRKMIPNPNLKADAGAFCSCCGLIIIAVIVLQYLLV